jgi:hypothetical protein
MPMPETRLSNVAFVGRLQVEERQAKAVNFY